MKKDLPSKEVHCPFMARASLENYHQAPNVLTFHTSSLTLALKKRLRYLILANATLALQYASRKLRKTVMETKNTIFSTIICRKAKLKWSKNPKCCQQDQTSLSKYAHVPKTKRFMNFWSITLPTVSSFTFSHVVFSFANSSQFLYLRIPNCCRARHCPASRHTEGK